MFKRGGERRQPWSRRLGERRKDNIEVEADKRKQERRKHDQRNSANDKRSAEWDD